MARARPRVPRWLLLASGLATGVGGASPQPPPDSPLHAVVRVVDGDTLIVEGVGRVRLIGVDTPESVDPRRPVQCFGREAAQFTRQLVAGRRVRLEYDWPRQDAYGRTLAYVFLPDGTFVNAEIIRQGFGFAYLQVPRDLSPTRTRGSRRGTGPVGARCLPAAGDAARPAAVRIGTTRPIRRHHRLRDAVWDPLPSGRVPVRGPHAHPAPARRGCAPLYPLRRLPAACSVNSGVSVGRGRRL